MLWSLYVLFIIIYYIFHIFNIFHIILSLRDHHIIWNQANWKIFSKTGFLSEEWQAQHFKFFCNRKWNFWWREMWQGRNNPKNVQYLSAQIQLPLTRRNRVGAIWRWDDCPSYLPMWNRKDKPMTLCNVAMFLYDLKQVFVPFSFNFSTDNKCLMS